MKKQISTGRIFALCLAEFARAIIGGLVITYLLKFFNVTEASGLPLLLPVGMIGLLRGIGVVFDAVTDPIVASWSDRCKNKNGRRIPFMRWSAIPYAVTCLLIFFPPMTGISWINVVWISFFLLAYYMASTLYCIPYMALSPELVTDTKRRVFFYTVSSLMFVLGSSVIYVLPVLVSVFKGSGMETVWAWRAALGIFAGIGGICALIAGFSIKEKDYVDNKPYYKPIFESIKATFAYKNYAIMTSGYLIMQVGFAFFNAALLFYVDTLLGLNENAATLILGISIVVGICTYPLVNHIARKKGKKPLLIGACCAYVFVYAGIYLYKPISAFFGTGIVTSPFLVGFVGEGATVGAVICALLIGILIAFPLACTNILPSSAFADLAQYDTIKTGENKTGMFVAARQFVTKIAQAIVSVIVSYVMYLGATNDYPTAKGVQATALIAAICLAGAVVLYLFYNDSDVVKTIDEYNEQKKAKELLFK